jgi:hypothetical protein
LELDRPDIEAPRRVNRAQPGTDRALGVVLMGTRVAEIDQHTVAHVFRYKAVKVPDAFGDSAMVCGDNVAQILGV